MSLHIKAAAVTSKTHSCGCEAGTGTGSNTCLLLKPRHITRNLVHAAVQPGLGGLPVSLAVPLVGDKVVHILVLPSQ